MSHIKIRKGLDVAIEGTPEDVVDDALGCGELALDLAPFSAYFRIKPMKNEGENVRLGEPLAYDVHLPQRKFISPAAGTIQSIIRGEKRRILAIVIKPSSEDALFSHPPVAESADKQTIIDALFERGLTPHIWKRPFRKPVQPTAPRSIFVSALESEPFLPPAAKVISGEETYFQAGLNFLDKIAPVHLVCDDPLFKQFQSTHTHTIEGPHPRANASVHIAAIDPITSTKDVVWTLKPAGVMAIGRRFTEGSPSPNTLISLAGEGVKPEFRKYYRVRKGMAMTPFLDGKLASPDVRIISGGPLTGVSDHEYLGFEAQCITVLPDSVKRTVLPFLRLGTKNYTSSRTYLSSLFRSPFSFTTARSGDLRAFVDKNIYQKVMPLRIPVEQMLKALIVADYEQAMTMGFLEIDPEDFALTEFICPSKISHMKIVANAIGQFNMEE